MTHKDPLAVAAAALERGRASEALVALREVWRATRDPELAASYELLLREFSAPAISGESPQARARSWRDRAERGAGDPLELPSLLADPWTPEVDELERLSALAAWSPDPWLASVLASRLLSPNIPPLPGARPVFAALIDLLVAQGDRRQLARLDRLPPTFMRKEVERARARLEAIRVGSIEPQQRAPAAALTRRAKLRRDHEARTAELLAAVHAAPERDEPRLVYADWLAARGDPHGEFIVLQIERAHAGKAPSARERALLERHGDAWAGPIHPLLGYGSRVFERGFLAAASLEVQDFHGEMVAAGEWATLRTLDGLVSDRLVRLAPLDHLRELYGYLQLERFVALRADNRLGAVETYECSLADPNLPLDVPLGLRTLLVRHALDDALLALAEAPAIAGLERLGVRYVSRAGGATHRMADHRERGLARHRFELLRGRLPGHVRRLWLIDDRSARASQPCGWTLTFERDELEVFSRLRVDWQRPAHDRAGHDALTQLLGVLSDIGLGSLRRLELGAFDDPSRALALERLAELAELGGCELSEGRSGPERGAGPRPPRPRPGPRPRR
ncbi:MAG: TIGR02996 domain-containing protein [Enhygromyxa sp.]